MTFGLPRLIFLVSHLLLMLQIPLCFPIVFAGPPYYTSSCDVIPKWGPCVQSRPIPTQWYDSFSNCIFPVSFMVNYVNPGELYEHAFLEVASTVCGSCNTNNVTCSFIEFYCQCMDDVNGRGLRCDLSQAEGCVNTCSGSHPVGDPSSTAIFLVSDTYCNPEKQTLRPTPSPEIFMFTNASPSANDEVSSSPTHSPGSLTSISPSRTPTKSPISISPSNSPTALVTQSPTCWSEKVLSKRIVSTVIRAYKYHDQANTIIKMYHTYEIIKKPGVILVTGALLVGGPVTVVEGAVYLASCIGKPVAKEFITRYAEAYLNGCHLIEEEDEKTLIGEILDSTAFSFSGLANEIFSSCLGGGDRRLATHGVSRKMTASDSEYFTCDTATNKWTSSVTGPTLNDEDCRGYEDVHYPNTTMTATGLAKVVDVNGCSVREDQLEIALRYAQLEETCSNSSIESCVRTPGCSKTSQSSCNSLVWVQICGNDTNFDISSVASGGAKLRGYINWFTLIGVVVIIFYVVKITPE